MREGTSTKQSGQCDENEGERASWTDCSEAAQTTVSSACVEGNCSDFVIFHQTD